jgi:TonB family protein
MPGWNEWVWFAILAGVALKSTAVLGVAWLAAALLHARSAAARHLVWTAAAAALLALPFLSVSLPELPVAAGALVPGVSVVFQSTATARADADTARNSHRPAIAGSVQPAPWLPDWRLGLMLLWTAGSVVALAQVLWACARMWSMRRAAKPSPDLPLSVELARGLGIRRAVDVLETADGTMPMTFGIVRPAVFMPPAAAEWSDERRRIVLLHELAHVLRGDVATQVVARLALVLNWWNPLAWKAWREFLKERERAADDLVLHAGARASDYASHLLEVARAMQAAPDLGWAAVAMARRSQLEGRLAAILDSRVQRKTAGRASALVAALVAVAIVAPLAAVRAQDVDATIRAAQAQKNHDLLDKAATVFEDARQFDTAQKLLESSAAIREEVSGKQSVDYGMGLMKIASLERKRNRPEEAEAFYSKAAAVLGERPEAAPALMYLGVRTLLKKDKNFEQAMDYFQRAQRLDASPLPLLWMAVVREQQGDSEEAEALYKSVLVAVSPESAEAATAMERYARFLQQQSRGDEAQAELDRAKSLRKTLSQQRGAVQNASVLRVGGGVTAPSVLAKIDPEYSDEARAAKIWGTVVAYVEIGPDGIAHNSRVVTGVGFGLDEKAIEAISKWRFKPGTKDGAAVTVAAHIEVNFKLL